MTKKQKLSPRALSVEELFELVEKDDRDGLKAAFALDGFDVNVSDPKGLTALHKAVILDKVEILDILTSHPQINIDAMDCDLMTPLFFAAYRGKLQSVELLLIKGADAKCSDKYRRTILMVASRSRNSKCVDALLDSGNCLPDAQDRNGWNALMYGVGSYEIVKRLVRISDLSKTDIDGYTVLHRACELGSLDTVKLIVEKGELDINIRSKYTNYIPLQASLGGPFLEIAEYLIEKGASLTRKDSDGHPAYDYAAKFDDTETFFEKYEPAEEFLDGMFRLLVQFSRHKTLSAYAEKCVKSYPNGPNVLKRAVSFAFKKEKTESIESLISPLYDKFLQLETPKATMKKIRSDLLLTAMDEGNNSAINYIMDRGVDPNEVEDGDSYLVRACRINNTKIVNSLLKLGADVNRLSQQHDSALHFAVSRNNLQNVRTLIEHGADPRVRSEQGFTPLILSAYHGHANIFFELFKVDKDLHQRSNDQITPFLAACKSGNMQIVKAIIEAEACLTDVDKQNRNCLHFAADKLYSCELMDYLLQKVDKQDFKTMITASSSEGHRPVDLIIKSKNKKMISKLLLEIPDLTDIFEAPTYITIQNSSQELCLICREEFVMNDSAMRLPCKHMFHENCYSEWSKQKDICPYCQKTAFDMKKP